MSTEQFKRIRTAVIGFALITLIFVILQTYVSHDTKFNVVHFDAVASTVGPDGRAAAGSPEVYQINISPALAWKDTRYAETFVVIGWIVWALLGVFIGLVVLDIIALDKAAFNLISIALLIIIAALIFAAYSSAYASNYKEVSPEVYLQYKDHLQDLFTGNLIR